MTIYTKDTNETLDFTFPFLSGNEALTDTIQSYVVEIVGDVVEANSVNDDKNVVVFISGGTVGTTSLVTVRITSVDGRIQEGVIALQVVDKQSEVPDDVYKVRFNIGDIDGVDVSDDVILFALSQYSELEESIQVRKATVDVLRHLIGKFASTATRRREREGGVEVEVYGNEKYDAYQKLYDLWTKDPSFNPYIGAGMSINTTTPRYSVKQFDDLSEPTTYRR